MEKKIGTAIDILNERDSRSKINLTDSDAPIMKGKKGNFDTMYNVQIGCNENQFIGYCDVVTHGNDKAQLVPTLAGIERITKQNVNIILADGDYGTLDSFEYMEQNNIEGYVPYKDMNTIFEDKPYHHSHFKYDNETDQYICPNNKVLRFRRIRENKQRNQKFKEYRTDECRNCTYQKLCCPKGVARRVISRELRQGLRDQMKQRLNREEGAKVYQRRLHPIEAIFGHIKYNLGYTYFLLRGLEKVKSEFAIMCISYNLLKLADYHSQIFNFLKCRIYTWVLGHLQPPISLSNNLRNNQFKSFKKSHIAEYQCVRYVYGQPE